MSKKKEEAIPLKPCPFCGSSAVIQKDITGKEKYHACCNGKIGRKETGCVMGAGMPLWRDTPEEAAADWNRRADG